MGTTNDDNDNHAKSSNQKKGKSNPKENYKKKNWLHFHRSIMKTRKITNSVCYRISYIYKLGIPQETCDITYY